MVQKISGKTQNPKQNKVVILLGGGLVLLLLHHKNLDLESMLVKLC